MAKAKKYKYINKKFDISSVKEKIKNTNKIVSEFVKNYNLKKYKEEDLDELNKKLKDAGVQDIVDSINAQTKE